MLSEQKIAKEEVTTFANTAEITDLAIGNSRLGIGLIMAMACFVGVWGCLCLANGIAQSQSVQELARGIFTAFTGI
ncbi:MAG: hypothetical protein AMJ61_04875 [Desulfobacterales bacterium SG8_35_2]|jgi:hypothetical protein|nr:MAG: hypothetical protein AMJ61_04875 [Desulfobacterales bacterium SG8_35_2]